MAPHFSPAQILKRISSHATLKPYHTHSLQTKPLDVQLDQNGYLQFSPNDIENPRSWSVARRCTITSISILLVVNATLASSGPSAVLTSIASDFKVTQEVAGLTVTIFLVTYSGGPLIWAPLSEHFGRRYVFYGAFLGYAAFNFLCAFAPNFEALLAGRFLTGVCASSTIANSPGLLTDIWDPLERGNAMALFSIMVFCGPAIGPIISGFLQTTENWRWVFFVLLWLAGATIPFLFMIPETLPSKVLLSKARRIREQQGISQGALRAPSETDGQQKLAYAFKIALSRPWRILIDPISLACTFYTAFVYALLYMLFAIYPIVFQKLRGWSPGVSELPLVGIIIGSAFGGLGVLYATALERKREVAGHIRVPEDRLPLAMIGGILFPLSMFAFAWTANYVYVPWIAPTLAGMFLAISFLFVSNAYLNYLADCYTRYAASALAANSIFRSLAGAATPLYTSIMIDSLGVAGGCSLIAGVACCLALVPFVFRWKGEALRRRSKFAKSVEN